MRFSHPAILAFGLVVLSPLAAWSQAYENSDDNPMAWVSLGIEAGRPTTLQVITSQDPGPIAIALDRITGHPTRSMSYGVGWTQLTSELPAPARDGLLLREDIAIEPLLETLHAAGQPTLMLQIRHPRVGYAHVEGAAAYSMRGLMGASISTAPPHRPLHIELGWRGIDVARAMILLLLAWAIPMLAGLAIWRRSAARDHSPQAWFGRAHSMQTLLIAGWVLWIAAIDATQVGDLTAMLLGSAGRSSMMTAPLWMLGFLPVALALMAMTRRMVRRLRGFDPQFRGGLPVLLRVLVTLTLMVVAASAFFAANPRLAVFALLGAVTAGVVLPGARGPLGTTPQALSSGALRDRLFDLAKRAGVSLRQLYVMPMRRERMANAFAVNGGVVMVADELLDRMSRREVDAVLAHEISHLEHRHPMMMVAGAAAAWLLVSVISMPIGYAYVVPMGITASWLAYLFVARRCEFVADAGAAALTGDAEAMISGLGQLSRLNDVPLTWERGRGWLITHPSTQARAQALGRRAGISPERIEELLTSGLPPVDHYQPHERPGEAERVFSTAWKTRTLGRLSLAMMAGAVLAPAAAVALTRALGLTWPHPALILGGALLAWIALIVTQDQLAARPIRQLEAAVRKRFGDAHEADALFVALSPGDQPRVYEGFLDWDLGILRTTRDRLEYRGEQIALDLPRETLRAIEVGGSAPGWLRAPRVVLRWAAGDGEASLTLRPANTRRVSAIDAASRALADRLRAWHERAPEGASGSRGPAIGEGPSRIGPVTSLTLAKASAPRDLPVLLVLIGIFSAAASYVLGLDFWLGLDITAAALIGVMAMRWPAMTSRDAAPAKAGATEVERRAA